MTYDYLIDYIDADGDWRDESVGRLDEPVELVEGCAVFKREGEIVVVMPLARIIKIGLCSE